MTEASLGRRWRVGELADATGLTVATVASGDRTERLRALDVPALVLHGLADTLCDPSGGRATAAALRSAELVLIEGMGHDLPPGLWQDIAEHIAVVVRRGEARASGTRRP